MKNPSNPFHFLSVKFVVVLILLPLFQRAQPTADFTISPSSPVCVNSIVTFTDASVGTGLSYQWNFGVAASPATANSVGPHQVQFTAPGQYWTYLVVTDGMGQDDTLYSLVEVIGIGPVTIQATGPVCQTTLLYFQAAINLPVSPSYFWDFGPGAIPRFATGPSVGPVQYPGTSNQYAKVVVTDRGCSDSASVNISSPVMPFVDLGNDTMICKGESLTVDGTLHFGMGVSYNWSCSKPGQCGISSPNAPMPIFTPVALQAPYDTICYYYSAVDMNGCVTLDTLCVVIAASPTATASPDTMVCHGDHVQLQGGYTSQHGLASIQWIPNMNLSNPHILNPVVIANHITTYALQITDSLGCTSSWTPVIISGLPCGQDSVWPGDANYDGVANNLDVLTLGMVYGRSGFTRPQASMAWMGQRAFDWMDTLSNGAEIKHADCNGDGSINVADTAAINLNYGNTHTKRGGENQGAFLFAEVLQDSLNTGDTATLIIHLGTDTLQADSIYGLAFTLSFDQSLLQDTGAVAAISYDTTWLGRAGVDLLNFDYYLPGDGEIDFAFTRLNQKHRSGFGRIARVDIIMVEDLSGKKKLSELLRFTFSDIYAQYVDGSEIPLSTSESSLVLTDPLANSLFDEWQGPRPQIYPQPVDQILVIAFDQPVPFQLSLKDLSGREVWKGEGQGKKQFDIGHLPAACYLLEIKTREGRLYEKLMLR